jgi:DNA-binding NtrC family response regulator
MEVTRGGSANVIPAPFVVRTFSPPSCDPLIGNSDNMRSLADMARRAAADDGAVLIEGELGTGKKDLAWWLHQSSLRIPGRFVELNCRIARRTLESKLFSPGALLDEPDFAVSAAPKPDGRVTLFLRNIEKLAPDMQSRLLTSWDNRHFRFAPDRQSQIAVRLITASEQKVEKLVEARHFPSPLYARISDSVLRIPPLRERLSDLPLLAAQILGRLARELGYRDFDLTRSALRILQNYAWPGNLRELRSVLERAVLVAGRTLLSAPDLQLFADEPVFMSRRGTLRNVEMQYIQQVLEEEGGRVESAARVLGVPRSSLYHKIKQYRIEHHGLRSVS